MASAPATARDWFGLADRDGDGALSGGEAVAFFQRSGLPRTTLAQVWELSAGGAPSLGLPQFWTALQLVSLAQRDPASFSTATAVAALKAETLPLPSLEGLPGPSADPIPPPVQSPNMSADDIKRTSVGSASSAASAGSAASSGWPSMTPAECQRYVAAFQGVDTDRDGWVSGAEVAPLLARSGLTRQQLKDVWDLVAGDRGALRGPEFVKAMYLVDCCQKGLPLPSALPPEPFPPTLHPGGAAPPAAPQWSPSPTGMGGMSEPSYFTHGKKRSSVEVPEIPKLELLSEEAVPASAALTPPALDDAKLRCLAGDQKQRLETERNNAAEAAAKVVKLEADAAVAQKKVVFYRAQVSRMTITKSRVDNVLMQAKEKAKLHQTEADAMATRYNGAIKAIEAQYGESLALQERGRSAAGKRAEAAARAEAAQAEVARLSAAKAQADAQVGDDQELAQLLARLAEGERMVAAAEARAMGCSKQVQMARAKLSALTSSLSSTQASAAITEGSQKTTALRRALASGASLGDKQVAVRELTSVHTALGAHAAAAGMYIPKLAAPRDSVPVTEVWVDHYTGDAWCSFKDEGVRPLDKARDLCAEVAAIELCPCDGNGALPNGAAASGSAAFPATTDAFSADTFSTTWAADQRQHPSPANGVGAAPILATDAVGATTFGNDTFGSDTFGSAWPAEPSPPSAANGVPAADAPTATTNTLLPGAFGADSFGSDTFGSTWPAQATQTWQPGTTNGTAPTPDAFGSDAFGSAWPAEPSSALPQDAVNDPVAPSSTAPAEDAFGGGDMFDSAWPAEPAAPAASSPAQGTAPPTAAPSARDGATDGFGGSSWAAFDNGGSQAGLDSHPPVWEGNSAPGAEAGGDTWAAFGDSGAGNDAAPQGEPPPPPPPLYLG
eukprot:jgi/Tetstr1/439492/TSEL_027922.t1